MSLEHKRKELSKYCRDYKNDAVMGLLEFLNENIDSEETYVRGYEVTNHIDHATLGCMSNSDESIYFYDINEGYATSILLLNNNKLLILTDSEESDDLTFTHFFRLYADASDFTVRIEKKDDKTCSIKFCKHGFKLEYPKVKYLNKELEDNTSIINYLKTVSFDELCERGLTDKPKVKSL